MKITLKQSHVAVLTDDEGSIVAVFNETTLGREKLTKAVSLYSDAEAFMVNGRDFVQPTNYDESYDFLIHDENNANTIMVKTFRLRYSIVY